MQLEFLCLSAQVADSGFEGIAISISCLQVHVLEIPAERVAIDIEVHCQWTRHVVAIEVGHFLDGDIDIALLYLEVRYIEVHQ